MTAAWPEGRRHTPAPCAGEVRSRFSKLSLTPSLLRSSVLYPLFLFFSRVVFRGCSSPHLLTAGWGCYYDFKKFQEGR